MYLFETLLFYKYCERDYQKLDIVSEGSNNVLNGDGTTSEPLSSRAVRVRRPC
jgi:hypothetical protein